MEGPIERFSENILVAKIISQYLTIPKELNSLLRVSKRFHRLVLNDGTTNNDELVHFSEYTTFLNFLQLFFLPILLHSISHKYVYLSSHRCLG